MRVPQSSPRRFAPWFPHWFQCPWAAAALAAVVFCSAACASSDEVAAAREAEEQWERVPVIAADAATGATAVAATEELRFDPGTAALTPAARASLDRLGARLRTESAGCQVDLRSAPSAVADSRLIQKRTAAVRRYLSGKQGIAAYRISDGSSESATAVATGTGAAPRCVLVANLG